MRRGRVLRGVLRIAVRSAWRRWRGVRLGCCDGASIAGLCSHESVARDGSRRGEYLPEEPLISFGARARVFSAESPLLA